MVITVSGLHGTGKSTYAKALSKTFNLKHSSAGILFRKLAEESNMRIEELTSLADRDNSIDRMIDSRMAKEAKQGGVVIDGTLSSWMAKDTTHIKIFLSASDQTRFERIAKREMTSIEEARKATLGREAVERSRFKRYYGIDINDLSIYDIVLNTELLPLESNIEVLTRIVEEYIKTLR